MEEANNSRIKKAGVGQPHLATVLEIVADVSGPASTGPEQGRDGVEDLPGAPIDYCAFPGSNVVRVGKYAAFDERDFIPACPCAQLSHLFGAHAGDVDQNPATESGGKLIGHENGLK